MHLFSLLVSRVLTAEDGTWVHWVASKLGLVSCGKGESLDLGVGLAYSLVCHTVLERAWWRCGCSDSELAPEPRFIQQPFFSLVK